MRYEETSQLLIGIVHHIDLDDNAPAFARQTAQRILSGLRERSTSLLFEDELRKFVVRRLANLCKYKSNVSVNKLKWELNKLLNEKSR